MPKKGKKSQQAAQQPNHEQDSPRKESEAHKVKELLRNMKKTVEEGEEWYIVSMAWINKWQKYVGFDNEDGEDDPRGDHPGQMDNSDIILFPFPN